MRIHINYNSGASICSQVTAQVKRMIVAGELSPGDKLPSIRELAKSLKVNPTTVSRIYNELEREGAVVLRQGQGAFVSGSPPQLSPKEIERLIGAHAQTLLVEGLRLGMDLEEIKELLDEEYKRINQGEMK